MKIALCHLPASLEEPVREIEPLLSYSFGEDGIPVVVRRSEAGCRIVVDERGVALEYHKVPELFRLLTRLPDRIHRKGVYEEFPAHEDLCAMVDCSRNAVLHPEGAKRLIRYLALMGFTSLMLYTEDTYEIPEYPYFGYMRGRFSQEELRQIDRYAAGFGIEVIPCIQVLAHLEGSLRWPTLNELVDVGNILMVGEEKTYDLIEAMIRSCRACYRSRRIHIGMDEAHLLGAGRYLDQNGYRSRSDIFLEHLDRVVALCETYGFEPMIWSDMFFRSAFHTYYVKEGDIPADVIRRVPPRLSLVYWDYYSTEEALFRHMVHCHKQFPNPTVFAGGAWKWHGMAPMNYYSLYVNNLHLRVAREEKIPMVIATCWGDNGAEASHFSVLPTLQQYAEYCYAKGEDAAWVKTRFYETFRVPFDEFLLLDSPNRLSDIDPHDCSRFAAKALLYNDPLAGWMDSQVRESYRREYEEKERALAGLPDTPFRYLFHTAQQLCRVLALKATLSLDIRNAYRADDREALRAIAERTHAGRADRFGRVLGGRA